MSLFLASCQTNNGDQSAENALIMWTNGFDWQGHRGARGLMPENSIPAFLLALEYPQITTLEMDVAVSKDRQLIVSHEPWLSHHICSWPDGRAVKETEEEELGIYQLTADELRAFDCGSRGNSRFPEQQAMRVYKPKLEEVVRAAEQRAAELGRPLPRYNIEIKSRPSWDGVKTPEPDTFARILLEALDQLEIRERTCIQSFDPRALEAVHALAPVVVTAFLVENVQSVEEHLALLSYTPEIYSPDYTLVTANLVETVHQRNMLLVPWTVNETQQMIALQAMGVDGIITDYPDRIPAGQ